MTHYPKIELVLRWALGAVFIAAAVPKIMDPEGFARILYGYSLFPAVSINLIAIFLPFLEFFCGMCLVLGIYPRGAALILTVLLAAFVIAISINLIRGHEFDCGCFSTKNATDPLSAWYLLIRDLLCLAAGLYIMGYSGPRRLSLKPGS